jgi:hypothetical protein
LSLTGLDSFHIDSPALKRWAIVNRRDFHLAVVDLARLF